FSDLISDAREQAYKDALSVGWQNDVTPLRDGGYNALAYVEALTVYLACAIDRLTDYCSTISTWSSSRDQLAHAFTRQAISMTWDYAEVNVFAGAAGDFFEATKTISKIISSSENKGFVYQQDARML